MTRGLLLPALLVAPSAWAAEPARPAALPELVGAGGLLQVMVALVLVLLLFLLLAWVLRQVGGLHGHGSGPLRLLAGMSVGQRERVVLVQVGERQLLLGVAPGRVTTLHVLEKNIDLHPPKSGDGFGERLAAALKRGGGQ